MITNTIWWSDVQQQIYGLKPGTFKGTYKEVSDLIHPDDVEPIRHKVINCIKNKTDYEDEFRIFHPDNTIHWIKTVSHFYYDELGKPVRMVGINYDNTLRKQENEALKFKAEATKILSSSLNYNATLKTLADLAVHSIADWCSVEMKNEESGILDLVAISHKEPEKIKWALQLRKENPPDLTLDRGASKVLRTGKPEFYQYISDEMLVQAAKDERELKLFRKLGMTGVITVPLIVAGKTIGVITFVSAESRRKYTDYDLQIAELIASRASLAIENSKLYNAVEKERERLNNLVANVPGVVWEAYGRPDENSQQIDFVSNHVEKMLGYTVDEWLSNPNFWLTIVHPEDKERAAKEATNIFTSKQAGVSRFRWMTKSGESVWVEAHSRAVLDEKGNSIGMRGVNMDISQRMELERRKDDFISMASHELKTPITSVKAYAQLLHQLFGKRPDDIPYKYLTRMETQIDKLTDLISDLLDASKAQQGKLEFTKELFDLNTLTDDVIENLQAIANNHTIVKRGKVKRKILADRDRIGQVMTNLITNAIKYSPNKDKVVVSLSEKNNHFKVSVKDFGIGIPKKHQIRIFQQFYRVHEENNKKFEGLGIGLYISHQIVQRHGGEMGVKSKRGDGSTFFFSMPIKSGKRIIN